MVTSNDLDTLRWAAELLGSKIHAKGIGKELLRIRKELESQLADHATLAAHWNG